MKEKRVIEDWVDGEEIRALAEKLLAPPEEPQEPAGSAEEAAYGPGFEGFAGPVAERGVPTQPGLRKELVEAVRDDPPPADDGETKIMVQPNPFHIKKEGGGHQAVDHERADGASSPFRVTPRTNLPSGSRQEEERPGAPDVSELGEFVDWLRGQIPLEACLMSSARSKILFDDLPDDRLRSVSGMLAGAAHCYGRAGGKIPGSMVVKLAPERVMQVIPVETPGGACFAALILSRPLADSGVRAFAKAFQKALV